MLWARHHPRAHRRQGSPRPPSPTPLLPSAKACLAPRDQEAGAWQKPLLARLGEAELRPFLQEQVKSLCTAPPLEKGLLCSLGGATSWDQTPEARALTAPAQPFLELPQWGPEGFWTRPFRDSADNTGSRTSHRQLHWRDPRTLLAASGSIGFLPSCEAHLCPASPPRGTGSQAPWRLLQWGQVSPQLRGWRANGDMEQWHRLSRGSRGARPRANATCVHLNK